MAADVVTAASGAPEGAPARTHLPLAADCSRCFALCCVALPLTASADFGIDKAPGVPCRNLSGLRCGIHARLRASGFRGCSVYDCFGAGQQTSQVVFAGRDWRDDPATAGQMFAVFPVVRHLHEMLAHVDEALGRPAAAPLHGELAAVARRLESLATADPATILAVDVPAERAVVGPVLERVSTVVRGGRRAGRSLRHADRVGADLSRASLRRADLRGALLIGTNLRGADLRDADLLGADLRDTDLSGADLTGALFLTQPQLESARGDGATRLPAGRTRPTHWSS